VNALVSLHQIYDIPALLVVSWRGQDGTDAPEHLIMGAVLDDFLRLLKIPFAVFHESRLDSDLEALTRTMRDTSTPVALVVPKGVLQQ
jgi:phosphonopyruvate decarboxylase